MFDKIKSFHNHPSRRPYWQILLGFVILALYKPAKAFVDWAEEL